MIKRVMPISLLLALLAVCGCSQRRMELVVFAAGSLILPFEQLEPAFEARHPEIDMIGEYHGSIQVMRHVTEMHESIDIVATADRSLVPMLMYAVNMPGTETPYASWYLSLATNRLGIASRPDSAYADEINADNWWEILARPDVRLGLSDPRFDPVGYRALMIFCLAQDHYDEPGIFGRIVHGQFRYPLQYSEQDGQYRLRIPEILETTQDAHIAVRGSSVGLIALLQAGEVDYAFEYESVIRQHGFEYLALPDALNLGDPAHTANYGRAIVEMDMQRFATVNPVFRGEQIQYAITIPASAPHPEEAALFIQFLFSEEGQAIMRENAHPLFIPPTADGAQNVPESLQSLLEMPAP